MQNTQLNKTHDGIILLNSTLDAPEKTHSFMLAEEKQLIKDLSEIKLDVAMDMDAIQKDSKKEQQFLHVIFFLLTLPIFISLGINWKPDSFGFYFIITTCLYFYFFAKFIKRLQLNELSIECYKDVANVAKYNPAVKEYVKNAIERRGKLTIYEYKALKISMQNLMVDKVNGTFVNEKKLVLSDLFEGDKNDR